MIINYYFIYINRFLFYFIFYIFKKIYLYITTLFIYYYFIYMLLLYLYIIILFIYYYLIYINLVWIFFLILKSRFFLYYNFLYFFIWYISYVPPSLSPVLFPSQLLSSNPYYFQNQIALRQNWRVKEHFGPNNFFFWVSSTFPFYFWSNILVCGFSTL